MSTGMRFTFVLMASLAGGACATEVGQQSAPAGSQDAAAVAEPAASRPPAPTETNPPGPTSNFVPPADGRLTAAHVQEYIAVRRRALELAAQKSGGAAALPQWLLEVPAAEVQAAAALGRDLREYHWVQARIAEAERPPMPTDAAEVMAAIEAAAAKAGSELQQTARKDGQRVYPRPAPNQAVVADNRRTLEPFRAELSDLERQYVPGKGRAPEPRS